VGAQPLTPPAGRGRRRLDPPRGLRKKNEEKRRIERLKKDSEEKKTDPNQNLSYQTLNKYGFENATTVVKVYITEFQNFKEHPKEKESRL